MRGCSVVGIVVVTFYSQGVPLEKHRNLKYLCYCPPQGAIVRGLKHSALRPRCVARGRHQHCHDARRAATTATVVRQHCSDRRQRHALFDVRWYQGGGMTARTRARGKEKRRRKERICNVRFENELSLPLSSLALLFNGQSRN